MFNQSQIQFPQAKLPENWGVSDYVSNLKVHFFFCDWLELLKVPTKFRNVICLPTLLFCLHCVHYSVVSPTHIRGKSNWQGQPQVVRVDFRSAMSRGKWKMGKNGDISRDCQLPISDYWECPSLGSDVTGRLGVNKSKSRANGLPDPSAAHLINPSKSGSRRSGMANYTGILLYIRTEWAKLKFKLKIYVNMFYTYFHVSWTFKNRKLNSKYKI